MKYIGLIFGAWILWVPITFWCGRVFCRHVCLLGLSQSAVNWLFHPKTHVRRVCEHLPRPWYQRLVNWVLVVAYFALPVGCFLNPWGVFGRVLALFMPGVVLFAAILIAAAIGKGRLWCNWVCPIGTMFDFLARIGNHADHPIKSCANCRRCFPKCK